MKSRLPVYVENLELPEDLEHVSRRKESYGYVSILYILSLIITGFSVALVIVLGK